jgi:hypothetical protein
MLDSVQSIQRSVEAYSSRLADIENTGHRFGTDLSETDKSIDRVSRDTLRQRNDYSLRGMMEGPDR